MNGRSVRVIYCDDVRMEVGNKQSYMGVYNGELLAHSFPISLPKLCILVEARTPISKPFQKMRVLVLRGDEIISEAELPPDALHHQPQVGLPGMKDENSFAVAAMMFVFSPLNLEEQTMLRIRVQTETDELKGTSLVIRTANDDEKKQLGIISQR